MKRTPLKRKTGLKRTPLKRKTGLKPGKPLNRGKGLRSRSKKREAEYSGIRGRRRFVALTLSEKPCCEVRWEHCQVSARDVHEVLARGLGGAIIPGDKADRQDQIFVAICRSCHMQLDLQPRRARLEGWTRGVGLICL